METKLSIDGLWTATFSTSIGSGTGVAVFVGGRVLGGDANYYYKGLYKLVGERIIGSLDVVHFFGPLTNVFGPVREARLDLDGAIGRDLMIISARNLQTPMLRMQIKLQRVSNT